MAPVMISKPVAAAIRSGDVTQAFRRWDTIRVKVGGTQLTSAGIVRFESVEQVDPADLTETDAVAAGMADLPALQRLLAPRSTAPSARGGKGGARIYRVTLRWIGEDPRIALRDHVPRGRAMQDLVEAVAKLDRGRTSGPWTREILEWIRAHPRVVSTELAALLNREVLPMKADIRKLKALGLTISHDLGYEVSPRGAAYLRHLKRRESRPTD